MPQNTKKADRKTRPAKLQEAKSVIDVYQDEIAVECKFKPVGELYLIPVLSFLYLHTFCTRVGCIHIIEDLFRNELLVYSSIFAFDFFPFALVCKLQLGAACKQDIV